MCSILRLQIPHVSASGKRVTPSAPNGIKLELFIFDTFPHAKRMAALIVPRDDEFAPVKNAPGAPTDSPDSARRLIYALSLRRLRAAGGALKSDASPPPPTHGPMPDWLKAVLRPSSARKAAAERAKLKGELVVEISPLLSYEGEGLESLKGQVFDTPLLLCDSA